MSNSTTYVELGLEKDARMPSIVRHEAEAWDGLGV